MYKCAQRIKRFGSRMRLTACRLLRPLRPALLAVLPPSGSWPARSISRQHHRKHLTPTTSTRHQRLLPLAVAVPWAVSPPLRGGPARRSCRVLVGIGAALVTRQELHLKGHRSLSRNTGLLLFAFFGGRAGLLRWLAMSTTTSSTTVSSTATPTTTAAGTSSARLTRLLLHQLLLRLLLLLLLP